MSHDQQGDRPKMTDVTTHRRAPQRSSAKGAAWAVLVTMGGTSIILNIWDATHAAHMFWLIACLKGLAPVLAAMFLSEAGARFDGGKTFRCVTFGIMAGAMVLSASAIATVLRPSFPAGPLGLILSWMFGLVLDAAALTGLWIILTERERKREAERQGAERDAAAELAEAVAEAEARVREMSAAEIAGLREELTAANATAEALRQAAPGARRKRSKAAAPGARKGAPRADSTEDVTTELRALQILGAHPELREPGMGSELGRRLGVSPGYGRKLHGRLTSEERPADPLQERPQEHAAERAEEHPVSGEQA